MTSRLTAICLGAAMALGVGAATPAVAAPLPAVNLDLNSASGAQVYKVHRWRGRRHCRSRWSAGRGWHRHRRACRGYRSGWNPGRGWRRHHRRDGCWYHPRYGLRCQF